VLTNQSLRIEPIDVEELCPGDNLFQGRLWAELKTELGWNPAAFRIEWRSRRSSILTLVRRLGPGSQYAYVPAGPDIDVGDDEQGILLESLSTALTRYLPDSTVYIRYDLAWRSPYAETDVHEGEPNVIRRPDPRIRELRMNFGTRRRNLRKAWTDIQPADTLIVDLSHGSEALLENMRAKTRYNLRLAGRRGVRVRSAEAQELSQFYRLYAETAERNRIRLHDYRYFLQIFEVAAKPEVPADVRLLFAERDGRPLAAMVLAVAGERATYLYGASSNSGRELMPTYALQWEAMKIARSLGCSEYDLFGVPPSDDPAHPMYGLYRFKTGFGGRAVHRRGCWDFPYALEAYEQIRARELVGAGYHLK